MMSEAQTHWDNVIHISKENPDLSSLIPSSFSWRDARGRFCTPNHFGFCASSSSLLWKDCITTRNNGPSYCYRRSHLLDPRLEGTQQYLQDFPPSSQELEEVGKMGSCDGCNWWEYCVVVIFLFVISFAVEGGRGFDILNDDLFHATSLNTFPVGRELTELLTYDTSSSGRHYFHGHFIKEND